MKYDTNPLALMEANISLSEMMYYLYLPIKMPGTDIRIPENLRQIDPFVVTVQKYCEDVLKRDTAKDYYYASARKGWATKDNPLNRPGWHCDGFGTDDANFVYWVGPGTRFTKQDLSSVSQDHIKSLQEYKDKMEWDLVYTPPEKTLYYLSPACPHATPAINTQGCMRQYIKISVSQHQYNLEDNSHNYLFEYEWKMHPRNTLRNDPHKAQRDYV